MRIAITITEIEMLTVVEINNSAAILNSNLMLVIAKVFPLFQY